MLLFVAAFALLGWTAAPAAAQIPIPHPIRPEADGARMARFYVEGAGRVGQFPGKLVCVHENLKPLPAATEECSGNQRGYALALQNGKEIHPLMADRKAILTHIRSEGLKGKEVVVYGRYYPRTGMILAKGIERQPEKTLPKHESRGGRGLTYTW